MKPTKEGTGMWQRSGKQKYICLKVTRGLEDTEVWLYVLKVGQSTEKRVAASNLRTLCSTFSVLSQALCKSAWRQDSSFRPMIETFGLTGRLMNDRD